MRFIDCAVTVNAADNGNSSSLVAYNKTLLTLLLQIVDPCLLFRVFCEPAESYAWL